MSQHATLRRYRRTLIATLVGAAFSSAVHSAVVTWVPNADGLWSTAANWSSNPLLPGAADDVTISVGGVTVRTITHSSGTDTINSLASDENLAITGGTLSVIAGFSNTANTGISSGGTLILGGASTTATLTMTGGTLDNFGSLTISGATTLSGGTMSNVGTVLTNGPLTISGGIGVDGLKDFQINGGATWSAGSIDLNPTVGNGGQITNRAGSTFNNTFDGFLLASNAGFANFVNEGTFQKTGGTGTTDVRVSFINNGSVDVQAGQLQFSTGGRLTHNGALTIAAGAVLDFASSNAITHTINTAATTITGTLSITGDNFVNLTTPHTIGGTGTFQHTFGQVIGSNLTLGPSLTVAITDGGHSGAATTTVQGSNTTISSSGLRLDGGRIFRNEGTVTQSASVDFNSRRSGAAEAGTGTVVNAAGGIWNSTLAASTNFLLASNQGGGDTGAGAVFTNQGTFNKQGAGTTDVRVHFVNDGTLNVQAGQLQFSTGGRLTHNGVLTIADGAVLDFASSNAITHTINTAATTITGTLSITGDNFVNLTTAHTIGGTGTFQHTFGQVIGSNLTLGPSLTVAITDGGHSGAATTTVQGSNTTISSSGLRLDGGRIFRNEGTVTQSASVDFNSRRSGAAEAGNGTVVNAAGATWNSTLAASTNFLLASNQGAGDTGAGAIFTNAGTFNKQGAGTTDVRVHFVNDGTLNVQAGQLQFSTGGRLTHNGALTIAGGAVLDFASSNAVTHTINTASTTIAGTLSITGDNFVNFTTPHTIGGTGTFQHTFGQVIGSNLTLGPTLTVLITDGGHSGAATTTVQGNTTLSSSGLRLDGGRIFRNEGTVTQSASVDFNSRRSGAAEAGNGTVVNAAGGIWNSTLAAGTNFLLASNQGAGDTGAGAIFTNAGTFNKQGAGTTDVRVNFINNGSVNVQAGQLQFSTGGALTHNGALTIAAGAVLDFASGNTVTHTINTAATTIAGTLSITADNFVNFTAPHTIGGTGTFQHTFGQVIGSNLTLGPTLTVLITDGGHSGAATTTVQGNTTLSSSGLRLDGGRIFRNEGTVTQSASVDFNSRRSGAAEAGNGTVVNAAGATWNSTLAASTNFLLASNQGAGDTGAGAIFTNAGTFNKQGAGTTDVRVNFINNGSVDVQAGQLQFSTGGALTHNGALTIAAGAVLDFASSNAVTHTINTAATTIAGTLSITGDNFVNFTTPHTIGGTGTFQHTFGQVTGSNLTLGPQLVVNITDGGHSGAATTTVQGATTINNVLRLDGGRIFRNEGTVTQIGNVDMNSRRSGAAEAGNGTVVNAAGATWNSNLAASTNFLLASNQGAGDTGAGAIFTNQGTFNKQGAGTTDVRVSFNNSGLVDVQAGTLLFTNGIQGTGTLQTSGGIADVRAASTTGNLFHNTNTANSLILGTTNITVSSDYNNANFGVGNSFNPRANVSGAGQILAAGNVAQAITGANVTNGNTATATLTIGSMHVGSNTFNFQVANTGTTGPSLRGAIQTSVNGGNITDPNISVTPQNWGPIAPGGASGNIGITVNAGTAGALSLQPNQQLHIANNFSNVAEQNLVITLAQDAAAFNLAAGSVTPSPVTLANQRVGASLTQALTVANTAPGGAFTETLSASFGANTGNATNNGGSASGIAGGASNNTALLVGVNTSVAGARSGTVTVNLASNEVAGSGLGNTVLTPQAITVSGNVYQAAIGQLNNPISLNFGTVQVGQIVTQNLSISNIATGAAGFVEDLNARFGTPIGTGAAQIVGTGSITGLAAGVAANTTSMAVGVNTGTAGSINGSIPINFFTAGTVGGISNSLGETAANSANFGVTGVIQAGGQVVNQASPLINTQQPVDLGNVRISAASPTAFVSVTNQATTAPQAALNASIATASPGIITASGSFSLLDPGQTNASSMQVGMVTTTAGAKNGTATISFVSDASNIGNCAPNCQLNLQSQNVAVTGNVFRLATGEATPSPLNLGNFRLTTPTLTGNLAATNTAAADGSSEQLGIQSATPSSALFTATNTLGATRVNAQATANNAVSVGLGTGLAAGLNTGSIAIQYLSDGTVSGTGAPINSNLQNVTVNATGYNAAAGSAAPSSPVTIANQRVGGTASQVLTVSNTAPAGSFTEVLNASFGANTGNATSSGSITGGLGTGGIAGNSNNAIAMSVGVDTSAAGARTGTVTLNYSSNGAGTSGLATVDVGSQQITVSGNVYQLAAGTLNTAPLNFGTVQVSQAVSQTLSITNSAVGPTGFVEDLNARFGTATGTGAAAIGGTGQVAGLVAGATDSSNMVVSVNTGSAQTINGNIPVNFFSAGAVNAVSNGLGEVGVGSVQYAVSGVIQAVGNVVDQAQPVINTPSVNLGNVRINSASPNAFVSVTNQATGNQQAALNASITGTPPITASGSFNLLSPGATNNNTLQVGMQTSTAGAVNGTATVSFVSDASNIGNCAPNCQLNLPSQNVNVSGNVYRLANPVLNTAGVTLAARVGDVGPISAISITNSSPDVFTEGLKASLGSAPAGFSGSGSIGNLAAGGTDASSLKVTLSTAVAGTFAGPLNVNFISTGEGTTGAADVGVGSASVALNGKVYTPAVAQVAPAVDFGIVHKGEVVSTRNVTVANIAAVSGLNDVLRGGFGGASGAFTASGNLVGVAAGATDSTSFNVALNTANAGIFTGSATATLASHNGDMADLALGSSTVALMAQVNNFANAALVKSGGEGALTRSGQTYTLDLGSLFDDSGIHSVTLGVLNDVLGPADLLDGNFDLGLNDDFRLSGFSAFFGLGAGALQDGLNAALDTDLMTVGTYVDRIILRSIGHNASGFRGALEDIVIELRGDVIGRTGNVPEPGTIALLVLGMLILMRRMRRVAR